MNNKTSFRTPVPIHRRAFAVASLLAACTTSLFAVNRAVPGAFPTIQAAVNAALPGDTITVAPGVYQENVVANVNNIQFIGKNTVWDGTLVNGTAGVCLTATGDNIVVQGFIFRAGQSAVAQVQITGTNARVAKCSSRGPAARFLRVAGNGATVDSCTLYAVDSTAIEIIGDRARVNKVKGRQCDDNVIRVVGNNATVTACNFLLCEDGPAISVSGNEALASLNVFNNCDTGITLSGTNNVATKNKATLQGNTFVNINSGSGAVATLNRVVNGAGTFISVNSDNALVEKNLGTATGSMIVTGDGVTVRGNAVSDNFNDRSGLTVNSRTGAGGGLVENNIIKEIAQTGLLIGGHNLIVRGNKVTGSGTEFNENGCNISGNFNRLTNNIVIGGGTHGFNITGATNTLVKCSAIDAAADGFHITGNGNTLLVCDAMLNTGEGLDNGGQGTTVVDSSFKKNRLDVANDGTFSNIVTFNTDNTFTTGGPAQLPQVD
jgi:hypothetical protein